MFPLSEILASADAGYRNYLAKKTGFVLATHNKDQLLHFWLHITKDFENHEQHRAMTAEQTNALQTLLSSFGYLPPKKTTTEHLALEEQTAWIFRHPQGGIFLPLEVFKSLMRRNDKLFQPYLFSLLYNLKLKEQHNLASLIGGDIQAQLSLTFEVHPLDMALVLYIWFAGKHLSGEAVLPEKGRILTGPWSFLRETKPQPEPSPKLLPQNPVPLWDYLREHFSHQLVEIEELRHHIKTSRKGFYRPLGLVKNPQGAFSKMFRQGFLIPLPGRTWNHGANADDIQVVCPREIYLRHEELRKKENNQKNHMSGKS